MKSNIKNIMLLCAGLAALSCNKTPEFVTTEVGPDMTLNSFTESTYMGANVKMSVTLSDKEFALSTVKAFLYYGEQEVASTTVRTKEPGTYDFELKAPLLKEVPNGNASLIIRSQNTGLGITADTVEVALKRPDFETLNLVAEDGTVYTLTKTEGYKYQATQNFPAYVNGILQTPEFADGEIITIGWDGSTLSTSKSDVIPFGSSLAGKYTITADLLNFEVSPTGATDVVSVVEVENGQVMNFGSVVNIDNWTIDQDFFSVDTEKKIVTFRGVTGLYRMVFNTKDMFIRVEPMEDEEKTLSLSADGTGAVWVIGANFGKPVIGPSWNTEDGAYPAVRVSDKVYEFTLAVPGQMAISGADFKFFHQKGWNPGEFKRENYAEVNLSPAFKMTDSGNIQGVDLQAGKGYKIILDLTGGVDAAKISYEEVKVQGGGLDISVNGEQALKLSSTVYKVTAVNVDQNSILDIKGIEDLKDWVVDQDHFEITPEGLKFKAISGFYSFEMDLANKVAIARHVKKDGKAATYKDEAAITFMGWGVGFPAMANQLAWDNGLLITLAQIEKGVYQFTGIACEDGDKTIVGNCWRYNDLSFKFFGQAGWGDEMAKNITLTDEAKKYLSQKDGSNVELILDHIETGDDGKEKKVYKPLELGATYRMTVTECSPLDGGKFNCTIDFRKL